MTDFERMLARDIEREVESAIDGIPGLTLLAGELVAIRDGGLLAPQISHSIGGLAMNTDVRVMAELAAKCRVINTIRNIKSGLTR